MTKILNTNHVILDIQTTNKAEAIEGLTNLLKKDGMIDCRETFIKDIWQREAEDLTGSENHIAIPYGKSLAMINTALTTGRTRQDIPWETLDGSSVRCIILFAIRLEDQDTIHTRLLSQIAGALADDDIIEQLLVEADPQKIVGLSDQCTQSDVL